MKWKWFAYGAVFVIALGIALFFLNQREEPVTPPLEVAGMAGGKAIYDVDVTNEVNRMATIGVPISRDEALTVLITRAVLTAEAAKQGISVKGSETEYEFSSFLASSNVTRAQFDGMLKSRNLTTDYFVSVLNSELTVKALVEANIPAQFVIRYNDVLALYNERYNGTNVSFDSVEKNLTDELTLIKQAVYRQEYMDKILSEAEVYVFS